MYNPQYSWHQPDPHPKSVNIGQEVEEVIANMSFSELLLTDDLVQLRKDVTAQILAKHKIIVVERT